MGLMMWLMNKNMSHQPRQLSSDKQKRISAADRLTALHEQRQILEAEIAETSRIAELEEQHQALLANPSSASEETPVSATSR
jgi:cell division protein FtsL